MRNVTQRATARKPSNVIPFPMRYADPTPLINKHGRLDLNDWLTGGRDLVLSYDTSSSVAQITDDAGRVIWEIRRMG